MAHRPSGVTRIVGAVVNPVIGAVELDDVLENVDIDAVLERIDIDHLISRIDIDALIQRVDIDALIKRVDIQGVIVQANVKGIMASKATRILVLIRQRLARADARSRALFRQVLRRPGVIDSTDNTAGPFTRLPAYLIDASIVSVGFSVGLAVCTYLLTAFLGHDIEPDASGFWFALAYSAVSITYFWASVALTGQTIGKAFLGVRVVRDDGERLGAGPALVRVLVFPLAFLFFGLGFAPIAVARRHRSLYDAASGSIVIYDET